MLFNNNKPNYLGDIVNCDVPAAKFGKFCTKRVFMTQGYADLVEFVSP